MLSRQRQKIAHWNVALDGIAAVLLLALTYQWLLHFHKEWEHFLTLLTGYPFHIQEVSHLSQQGWLFLVILSSFALSFTANRFHYLRLEEKTTAITFQALKCTLIGTGLTVLFFFFFSIIHVNRSLIFLFAGLFFCWVVLKEVILRHYVRRYYLSKHPHQALLITTAASLEETMDSLKAQGNYISIAAILLLEGDVAHVPARFQPLVGGKADDLSQVLAAKRFDLVYLREVNGDTTAILRAAEEQGVEVWQHTPYLHATIFRPRLDEYAGQPMLVFRGADDLPFQRLAKRGMDFFVSVVLLLALSPLLLLIALLVKTTSQGPVFFIQPRTGYKRREFPMFKFRTMVADADHKRAELSINNEMSGPVFKIKNDPRITRVGKVLRRFSLDELPQLFNVVRGEMSLVGPRPLPTYETSNFAAFRDYRRYMVLPGLTGLWQVSGRNDIPDFNEWVRLDLEYIDNWSIWLDLLILCKTLPAVLKGEGQ